MPYLLLLAVLATIPLAAEDLVYDSAVEISHAGGCTILRNPRDRQELLIITANIVAVVPAEIDNNNSYTEIVLTGSGNVIRLQQRNNPVERIMTALTDSGFGFIRTASDRDAHDKRDYLLNLRRIDLIERTKTEIDRSDTIVHYQRGNENRTIVINQGLAAYDSLRARILAERL